MFGWSIDVTEGCRIVAGYFRRFLNSYQAAGAALSVSRSP